MSRIDGEKPTRDSRGRFLPGNPGGPGRPPRATELAYLQRLAQVVDLDEFTEVVRAVLEKAKGGDLKATELILRYLCPRTIDQVPTLEWLVPGLEDTGELLFIASMPAVGRAGEYRRNLAASVLAALENDDQVDLS